jgi:uncharacterized protein
VSAWGSAQMTPKQLLAVIRAVQERATDTARRSELHGERHWRDVARIVIAMHERRGSFDRTVGLLFAILHDSRRKTDGPDPKHGERAAALARRLRTEGVLTLSDAQAALLDKALVDHDKGTISGDGTIGACWDADRSTLWRVGIKPDPRFFSTPEPDRWIGLGWRVVSHGAGGSWSDVFKGRTRSGPLVLYHGTAACHLDSIKRTGIRETTSQYGDGTYLTPSRHIADRYATKTMAGRLFWYRREGMAQVKAGALTLSEWRANIRDIYQYGVVFTVHVPAGTLFISQDDGRQGFLMPKACPPEWIVDHELFTARDLYHRLISAPLSERVK